MYHIKLQICFFIYLLLKMSKFDSISCSISSDSQGKRRYVWFTFKRLPGILSNSFPIQELWILLTYVHGVQTDGSPQLHDHTEKEVTLHVSCSCVHKLESRSVPFIFEMARGNTSHILLQANTLLVFTLCLLVLYVLASFSLSVFTITPFRSHC